jgi:AraC-like DNA-binding protein
MTDVDWWRQAMSEAFVPLRVSGAESRSFTGTLRTDKVGRLTVTSLRSTPQRIDRTPALIAGSDRELWQIALCRGGSVRLEQDERQVRLAPGDLVAYETARPFRWSFPGSWTATVFTLPRSAVALTNAESRALTARRLPGGAGVGGLISRLLRDVADHTASLALTSQDRVVDDLCDLFLTLLRDTVEDGRNRPATRHAQLGRVKDHIEAHLREPGLTPSSIAAALHISVRQLHALFADQPTSVAGHIRDRRLRNCARDLIDPRLADVPVAALATRNGFGDTRGFERAFKATYGTTPGRYRTGRTT